VFENSKKLKGIISILILFVTISIFLFYKKVVGSIGLILGTYLVIINAIILSFIITRFVFY